MIEIQSEIQSDLTKEGFKVALMDGILTFYKEFDNTLHLKDTTFTLVIPPSYLENYYMIAKYFNEKYNIQINSKFDKNNKLNNAWKLVINDDLSIIVEEI